MEHYKLSNGKKISLPTGWHEVPFWKGEQVVSKDMRASEVMALLSDTNLQDIVSTNDPESIHYMMETFFFLKAMPSTISQMPNTIKYGMERIVFPFVINADISDLGEIAVGQIEDMQSVIGTKTIEFLNGEQRELTELETIKLTPYVVAIYVQKHLDGEYNGEKALELVEGIKREMSFKDVVSIGYFFFSEIIRLTKWVQETSAPVIYNQEEIMAGIQELNKAFGFYSTLDMVSKYTGIQEKELLSWSYYKFYWKVIYLSHRNKFQKDLREIYKTRQ